MLINFHWPEGKFVKIFLFEVAMEGIEGILYWKLLGGLQQDGNGKLKSKKLAVKSSGIVREVEKVFKVKSIWLFKCKSSVVF